MKKIAIILFGGSGSRFNQTTPKQFININNLPLCYYSIAIFNKSNNIDEIALVIREEDKTFYRTLIEKYQFNKVKHLIVGGETRFNSSYSALKYLENLVASEDIILIHDGARLLIDENIINNNVNSISDNNGVITAIKSTDSIINGSNMEYLKRDNLYNIQTPQTFIYQDIFKAYQMAITEKQFHFTDDGEVFTLIGKTLKIVAGSNKNIKLTTEFDLEIIKKYLA